MNIVILKLFIIVRCKLKAEEGKSNTTKKVSLPKNNQ